MLDRTLDPGSYSPNKKTRNMRIGLQAMFAHKHFCDIHHKYLNILNVIVWEVLEQ